MATLCFDYCFTQHCRSLDQMLIKRMARMCKAVITAKGSIWMNLYVNLNIKLILRYFTLYWFTT